GRRIEERPPHHLVLEPSLVLHPLEHGAHGLPRQLAPVGQESPDLDGCHLALVPDDLHNLLLGGRQRFLGHSHRILHRLPCIAIMATPCHQVNTPIQIAPSENRDTAVPLYYGGTRTTRPL